MQFFWKYIDDLMGKGIETYTILRLLFYVSASLIPLALPLAILLSSIMTMGNLAEHNELTALKASGLPLKRILRPLLGVVLIISLCTFLFANYVIPVANFKWHSIIYDVQNTKLSTLLTPGSYSNSFDGYSIKVEEGSDNSFKGVLIHDHTSPNQIKTIRAKEGTIYRSTSGKHIFFELKDGSVMEELSSNTPVYSDDGAQHGKTNTFPARRSNFTQATYKIDFSGFESSQSDENLFKDKHEMLNVFQIDWALDSIQKHAQDIQSNFNLSIKNDHLFFKSKQFQLNTSDSILKDPDHVKALDTTILLENINIKDKISAINIAQSKIRLRNDNIESQKTFMNNLEHEMDRFLIEFHRKFALTAAIIVLFFVGAPLGAIVRKGGFGAPVVIAALLFMIYFVLISIGDSMAMANTVSPYIGMWFATFVLIPIAFWLMRSAAKDIPLFGFIGKFKSLIKRVKA